MTFRRAIPKPTASEQARQDKCREMGCIACRMERDMAEPIVFQGLTLIYDPPYCGAPEIHHLTKSGRQIGQDESVCLGTWHHRAIILMPVSIYGTSAYMTDHFGPSLAKGSKPFYARYGSNQELLDYQNRLIA